MRTTPITAVRGSTTFAMAEPLVAGYGDMWNR